MTTKMIHVSCRTLEKYGKPGGHLTHSEGFRLGVSEPWDFFCKLSYNLYTVSSSL